MAAGGTSSNVQTNPGRLYYAALGTTEPTDASTALPSAWKVVGYTDAGTTFSFNYTTEDINVAEEVYPVLTAQTAADGLISFEMSESTRKRLALAFGAGAAEVDSAASFEPPDLGLQVSVMFVWDLLDTASALNVRWLFRKCYPAGAIEIRSQKAPNVRLVPVSMKLLKPDAAAVFKVFPNSAGLI